MAHPHINLIKHAHAVLRERNILPGSESAYEIWFRHFDGDAKEIIESVKEHGDILPWLYDQADLYANTDANYSTPHGRKVARRLLSQFAN